MQRLQLFIPTRFASPWSGGATPPDPIAWVNMTWDLGGGNGPRIDLVLRCGLLRPLALPFSGRSPVKGYHELYERRAMYRKMPVLIVTVLL